jgi:hypothetical protein
LWFGNRKGKAFDNQVFASAGRPMRILNFLCGGRASATRIRSPQQLSNRLMEADYRLATCLSSSEQSNCYQKCFTTFARSNFVTFNHDCLPEIFLHRAKRWYPLDGYGVPVEVGGS